MKEAYAVRRTVPPSAEIEARIEQLLAVGVGDNPRESLSELAKLGARLIIQRAVEDELSERLLAGEIQPGQRVRVDLRDSRLHVETVPEAEAGRSHN